MANDQATDQQQPTGTHLSEQLAFGFPVADLRSRALLRAGPFGIVSRMLTDMNQLMDTLAALQPVQTAAHQPDKQGAPAALVPPLEMLERNGQLVIRADMPGLSSDHIKVEVEDHQLLISGEREDERAGQRGDLYRSERWYGSFSRIVPLPDRAQPEQATASFRDGVLEIVMPARTRGEARRIEVQEERTTHAMQSPAAPLSADEQLSAHQPSA